jgi:hypothetical protein
MLDPIEPIFYLSDPPEPNTLAERLYFKALDISERDDEYEWIEDIDSVTKEIQDGLYSWYEIGLKAWKVKLYRSWRDICKSFRQYCEEKIGVTVSALNGKIRAARVINLLIADGFTRFPNSQSVAQALSIVPIADLSVVWQKIINRYPDHEISLERVKAMIPGATKEPQTKGVRLSLDLYDSLREAAAQAQLSPQRLLNQIVSYYLGDKADVDERVRDQEENPTFSEEPGMGSDYEAGGDNPPEIISEEAQPDAIDCDSDDQGTRSEQWSLQPDYPRFAAQKSDLVTYPGRSPVRSPASPIPIFTGAFP